MAVSYQDIYEFLRKEKYSEQLQVLPRTFIAQVAEFFRESREKLKGEDPLFSEELGAEKKQLENAISIFRELMLKRKKKILNLVFVASETGIMKRDFGSMLRFEQELFEKLVSAVESGDKDLNDALTGKVDKEEHKNRLIIIDQPVEDFVDLEGNSIGPFEKGHVANLNSEVAKILVSDGKARFVDE